MTTAFSKKFEYVKKLGASQVFDHHSSSISNDLIEALKDKDIAGVLDCVGGEGLTIVVNVLHKVAGKGIIVTTKGGVDNPPEGISIGRIMPSSPKDKAVMARVSTSILR